MNGVAEPEPDPVNPDTGSSGCRASASAPDSIADPTTPSDVAGPTHIEAFTAFYRGSAPRLVAFLRWQGAPLPDAADCAQEALTEAFQHWQSIREPHAWCRRVASRRYARRLASLEESVEDPDTAHGAPLLAPDTDLENLERHHQLLQILDLLPMRQRQVMAWTYDGATPTEIAAALQISPEAVRSNLYKARATLRSQFNEHGDDRR